LRGRALQPDGGGKGGQGGGKGGQGGQGGGKGGPPAGVWVPVAQQIIYEYPDTNTCRKEVYTYNDGKGRVDGYYQLEISNPKICNENLFNLNMGHSAIDAYGNLYTIFKDTIIKLYPNSTKFI